MNICSVGAD